MAQKNNKPQNPALRKTAVMPSASHKFIRYENERRNRETS